MNRGFRGGSRPSPPSRPIRGDFEQGGPSFGGPRRQGGFRGPRGREGSGPAYGDQRGRGRGGGWHRGRPRYGGNYNSPHPTSTENEKYIFRKGNGNHYPRDVKDTSSVPHQRLSELDVGITEYISTHEGFSGIIKQRFSDFHVNEVDSDGNIVMLNSLEIPETTKQDTMTLEEVLPKETVDKLRTLRTELGGHNRVEIDVSAIPKDERKRIHIAIRGEFGDKLNSNTKTTGETKILVIARSDNSAKQDVRLPWPEDRAGKYLHFVLYKENLDTMDAVNFIASRFRMNPSLVTYAGTKDKRAMTSQLVAMYKVEPVRLIEMCMKQNMRMAFGNFQFKPEPLKLGSLLGNRFRITLRNVTGTDEQIEQSMTSLKENGFINYYGLQRFGNNSEVPTYEIGRQLLLGNWKKVVELILKPRDDDNNEELNRARRVWWETRHAAKALNAIKRQDFSLEGKLLAGLAKRGDVNYMDALEYIPRNTRLLYLHAYQSLVWNKVVSRRLKEFGMKPILGDLVLLDDIKSEVFFEELTPQHKQTEGKNEANVVEDEVKVEEQVPTVDKAKIPEKLSKRPAVKALTEKDLANHTIGDIILPLPGFDVVFPDNCIKLWYEEYLSVDELSIADMKQHVKKYSLGGAYRKLIVIPENFAWRTKRYTDAEKPLVLSDLELLNGSTEPEDEPEGKYRALLLDLQLPSSAYATMALREILKQDTSTSFQASLNAYHKDAGQKRKEGSEEEESASKKTKVDQDEELTSERAEVEVIALEDDGQEVMEEEDDDVVEVEQEK